MNHDVPAADLAVGQLAGRSAAEPLLGTGVRFQFGHETFLLFRTRGTRSPKNLR